MLDALSSFFHAALGYLLLAAIVFAVIALSMGNVGGTIRQRVSLALGGTAVVVTLFGFYDLFSAKDVPSDAGVPSTSKANAPLPTPPSTGKDPGGTTVYLRNYRHKGDEPVAINCVQRGAQVECKSTK